MGGTSYMGRTCTLDFKGGSEAERPGCISLEGNKLTAEDLAVGGVIELY